MSWILKGFIKLPSGYLHLASWVSQKHTEVHVSSHTFAERNAYIVRWPWAALRYAEFEAPITLIIWLNCELAWYVTLGRKYMGTQPPNIPRATKATYKLALSGRRVSLGVQGRAINNTCTTIIRDTGDSCNSSWPRGQVLFLSIVSLGVLPLYLQCANFGWIWRP